MSCRLLLLVPALLMAGGILAGTAVSARLDDGDPGLALVLIGPAILALTMLAGCLVARRQGRLPRGGLLAGTILAASVMVACTIAGWNDPARVTDLLPLLGGGGILPLISGGTGTCARA